MKAQRWRLLGPAWALPAVLYLSVAFIAPLLDNFMRGSGSADAYRRLLTDPYYLGILGETVWVSIATSLLCLLTGYPVAYFMVRHAGRSRSALLLLVMAPLLVTTVMRTFGWRALLSRHGFLTTLLSALNIPGGPPDLLNSQVSVYLGLVHVMAPFMIMSVAAVLQGLDPGLEEGARVLGASRLRAFLSVTLPLSREGIVAGSILVFMVTNGSFITMLLLGGGKIVTLPVLIYQQFNLTQDVGFAAAMGNLLLVAAMLCLALQAYLLRRRAA